MPEYKALISNRKANFDYALNERLLAGVVLTGQEVKSLRAGHAHLKGAFATLRGNELWLNNTHISAYPPAKSEGYDPTRARKLLVKRNQLAELARSAQSGLSIVVLSIGVSGSYIKVELGIGRGRKRHDKREVIKQRQANREAAKVIKSRS